jgi:hypothetical protein
MSQRDILLRIEKLYDLVLQLEQKRREEPQGDVQPEEQQHWSASKLNS